MQGPPGWGGRGLQEPPVYSFASKRLQGPQGPGPLGASRGLQGPPGASSPFRPDLASNPSQNFQARFWGGSQHPALQGPPRGRGPGASRGPPGASKGPPGASAPKPSLPDFGGFPGGPPASRPSPADLLQLGARTLQGGPPRRSLKMWACQVEALILGFRVFPSRGKSMYIVYIWPTGVAGGRAVPPDVREEPGGALYVHSP